MDGASKKDLMKGKPTEPWQGTGGTSEREVAAMTLEVLSLGHGGVRGPNCSILEKEVIVGSDGIWVHS